MSSLLKSKKYWIFYFLIQLPLAILGIKGFHLIQLFTHEPQIVYTVPQNGGYELYRFDDGKVTGTIELTGSTDKKSSFRCDINGKEMEVFDEIRNKNVKFLPFACSDADFMEEQVKDETFWHCKVNGFNVVIANLFYKDNIYLPKNIPIVSDNCYLLIVLNDEDFKYITSGYSSLKLHENLLAGYNESLYAAIFTQKKK